VNDTSIAIATNVPIMSPPQGLISELSSSNQEIYVMAVGENSFVVLTIDPRSFIDLLVQTDVEPFELRRAKIRELIITNPIAVALFASAASFAIADAFGGAHVANVPFWVGATIVMFGVAGSGIIYLRRLCP
jgi:hypothetical protein